MSAALWRPGRRGGEAPPSAAAAVVLVPTCGRPARAVIQRAVAEAGDGTVAVVVLLKIHGSAWGFPNPGLLPNAGEKADARRDTEATIAAVERLGGRADGQITATRQPAKVIAGAAKRRRARLVLIEEAPKGRVRSIVEDRLGASVRRRLRGRADVEVVLRTAGRKVAG